MNTTAKILEKEKNLSRLSEYTKYKIVCFGASAALKRALESLKGIHVLPALICDNDSKKHGTKFCGYKIHKPDEVFSKDHQFFVIITSMYYSEINEQLGDYHNVVGSLSYLNLIPADISLSVMKNESKLLSKYDIVNTKTELYVKYDDYFDDVKYENDLRIARSYGIKDFIFPNKESDLSEINYLNYTSYCNQVVFEDKHSDLLNLIETKYNFNELKYKRLLEYYIFDRYKHDDWKKPIIINSWSLFTQGQLLETTSEVLRSFSYKKFNLVKATQKFNKIKDHALVVHLYHLDMFDEIQEELTNCDDIFDIYISLNSDADIDDIHKVLLAYPDSNIFIFENRGRDILPFRNIFRMICDLGYISICKIHTKKSIYRYGGKDWGKCLRTSLFAAKDSILKHFENDFNTGAFVAKDNLVSIERYLDANRENIEFVSQLLELEYRGDFSFPLGAMFWCRPEAIKQLATRALESKYFMIEDGCIDGQIEHAIEMTVGLLITSNGYEIKEI